jgi:hypothetical protein
LYNAYYNLFIVWYCSVFAGDAPEQELALIGQQDERSHFYANLYLGLYAEARGDAALARQYIGAAVSSPYRSSGDYMWSVAAVHKQVREW